MGLAGRTTRTSRTTQVAGLALAPLAASALLAVVLLAGCRPAAPDNHALVLALRAGRSAEVTVRGQVTGVLPDETTGPDGPHERFLLDLGGGVVVEVDHNLTLAPRVPVTPGSTVTVHGQFEPDPGHPVIHYTHHATGSHEGGWVDLNGHRYG